MFKRFILIIAIFIQSLSLADVRDEKFNEWVGEFKSFAYNEHGFSYELLDSAFLGVKFNPKIVDSDRGQAEFVRSMGNYLKLMISSARVNKGQTYLQNLSELFSNIYSDYEVSGNYLVSFWAMETNFSSYTGKMDLIEGLATLAFEGRRGQFFKRELLEALKILGNENFVYPGNRIQGSWAGAIGSTQFIPSNINAYAHDYDGDGIINMWSNRADFLGSSGKFLQAVGWIGNEKWGYEVDLPQGFDYLSSGLHIKKSVSAWEDLGLKRVDQLELQSSDEHVSLYIPQGHKGPKFLVYKNFRTIFKWNNSSKYALAVSILADYFKGDASYMNKFDLKEESFLTFKLTEDLQSSLNELGFDAGVVDGMIGPKTYSAVQKFQASRGFVADGHLSLSLMNMIIKLLE